mmetsp:Transcript_19891/g.23053  ORF Transcript_19891/g.23053 Transcript_19891/m.23053 type:complete len:160 (-) Transcript_19891:19-498(-)
MRQQDPALAQPNKNQNNLVHDANPDQDQKSGKKSKFSQFSKNNPEIFKAFVSQLKTVFNNNTEDNIQQIDKKSQKIIKTILELENSIVFHFCDFVTFWFEYYMRIMFPIAFLFYMIYIFVVLLDNEALSVSILVIEILIFVGIIAFFIINNCVRKKCKK